MQVGTLALVDTATGVETSFSFRVTEQVNATDTRTELRFGTFGPDPEFGSITIEADE